MATLLPNGIVTGFGPLKTCQGGQFDYNSASGTYSLAKIQPNTIVEDVAVFVATAWSGGGAACFGVGDCLATRSYFAQVTVGTAGGYHSFKGSQANALGTLYPANSSATQTAAGVWDIVAYYTQDASDTQGTLAYYVTALWLGDLSTGALILAIQ